MTPSNSEHESDEIIARFMRDFDAAEDKAVVEAYCAKYPDRADDFRGHLAAHNQMGGAAPRPPTPPEPQLVPDEMLGDFRVVRFLMHGGMGEIYEAEQLFLCRRRVALKVIRNGKVSPQSRARFLREREALARLHQSHIVPVFAAGERDDIQFFAMQFIDGATLGNVVTFLRRELDRDGTSQTRSLAKLVESVVEPPKVSQNASTVSQSVAPVTEADAEPPPSRNPVLTGEYCRSVAAALADVGDALDAAHRAGVTHRDVKPSNLMAEKTGKCWVIDFGLAGLVGDPTPAGETEEADPALTAAGTVMGTLPYMAPEQFGGVADCRSDVWALGVTLYELLALRRPFAGPKEPDYERQAKHDEPPRLRDAARNVHCDLEAICRMAMRKEPANRYQTAAAFASDLRRWLRGEPTAANPPWVGRRAAMWARRKPGWAAASAVACLALLSITGLLLYSERLHTRAAKADADRESERASVAEEKLREQERAAALFRAADVRAGVRNSGWSDRAWKLAATANRVRSGPDARDEAAASLVGVDAKLLKQRDAQKSVQGAGASGVAFSPDGKWVLAGGTGGEPTWLWNRVTGEEKSFAIIGDGPVGFRTDGTAVRALLPTKERKTIQFRDVSADTSLREFGGVEGRVETASLSADAGLLAVSSGGAVAVWDTSTGTEVRRFKGQASGLAFSPDGKLLAVGTGGGAVELWPLSGGDPLPTLPGGRTPVLALAFGRTLGLASDDKSRPNWRLAAGDGGGTITVWDLSRRHVTSIARGSSYGVHAVAFSPDGVTLASVGRDAVKVWDAATGRLLLNLHSDAGRNWFSAVAYQADGSRLVVGSLTAFGKSGGVDVWEIEGGRGVRTLRGLGAHVSRLAVSSDGKRVAALSHDWQVGIWDIETSRLLLHLDAPRGVSADNAGFAFSPNGERFAFSAGEVAVVWQIESGKVHDRWALPRGISDALAFHPDGGLFLFRVEPRDGKVATPIRELRPGGTVRDVCQALADSTSGVNRISAVSGDGRYFAVSWEGKKAGRVRVYESSTGAKVWPTAGPDADWFAFDPAGRHLVAWYADDTTSLVELPSGKAVGPRPAHGLSWFGPGGEVGAGRSQSTPQAHRQWVAFKRADTGIRLVEIDAGTLINMENGFFTRDGSRYVWGNEDGSVMVCDLPEVNRRLTTLGLGW